MRCFYSSRLLPPAKHDQSWECTPYMAITPDCRGRPSPSRRRSLIIYWSSFSGGPASSPSPAVIYALSVFFFFLRSDPVASAIYEPCFLAGSHPLFINMLVILPLVTTKSALSCLDHESIFVPVCGRTYCLLWPG